MSAREIPVHVLAEWHRKYRRCAEHNQARYYCGCAAKDER